MVNDTILELQNLVGDYFASAMGEGIFVGLMLLLVFAILAFFLRLPLEVCIVVAVPLIFILITGAGLPPFAAALIALAAGAVAAIAILRLTHR